MAAWKITVDLLLAWKVTLVLVAANCSGHLSVLLDIPVLKSTVNVRPESIGVSTWATNRIAAVEESVLSTTRDLERERLVLKETHWLH
mmetsp:Transcript_13975/g.31069  ORF Transcript_13975/g.31069 Transcript_13975/m.31069 type:complete len:88 (+) Transcript_13975:754-1017(+)